MAQTHIRTYTHTIDDFSSVCKHWISQVDVIVHGGIECVNVRANGRVGKFNVTLRMALSAYGSRTPGVIPDEPVTCSFWRTVKTPSEDWSSLSNYGYPPCMTNYGCSGTDDAKSHLDCMIEVNKEFVGVISATYRVRVDRAADEHTPELKDVDLDLYGKIPSMNSGSTLGN